MRFVHFCGGGYMRIRNAQFPLPHGRPKFRCMKCGEEWTEGHLGGESLRRLVEAGMAPSEVNAANFEFQEQPIGVQGDKPK